MHQAIKDLQKQKPEVSIEEWDRRKQFTGFTEEDAEFLRKFRSVAEDYADEVIESLYKKFLQFHETKTFFTDKATLNLIKTLQKECFLGLTSGEYGEKYLLNRLYIGRVYQVIKLSPRWYIGAYSVYKQLVYPKIIEAYPENPQTGSRVFLALIKLIALDQELAVTAYMQGAESVLLSSEENTKKSLTVTQAILESTADGIVVINLEGVIVAYNNRFMQMWGLSTDNMSAYNRQSLNSILIPLINDQEEYLLRFQLLNQIAGEEKMDEILLKNGDVFEIFVKQHVLDGEMIGNVFNCRDITLKKKLETQLLHQATYDTLTELPNRALSLDLINRTILRAKRASGIVDLFYIDIDKFSQVNNLLGRSKGDILLKMIVNSLKDILPEDCELGRMGGDEFVVIHYNLKKIQTTAIIVNRLLNAFDKPFYLNAQEIQIGGCIGIASYPKDGLGTDALIGNANIAMLRAKKTGRNTFQFYTQEMTNFTLQQIAFEAQLHNAIKEKQFIVYYQPIFNIKQKLPIGVEALVRWRNSQGELVPPMDFIPLAEELGLISQISELVIMAACKQAKTWYDAGLVNLTMAVNISAHQFKYGTLVNIITDALEKTQINPSCLELELTESVFINSLEEVNNTLRELSELGINISIDDFGTGYSSFSYLKNSPVRKIKIDKSFIANAVKSEQDQTIVSAMVAMGKGLKFHVLAEGIETLAQLELLEALGCEQGQGFYFAKPLPEEECTLLLKSHLTCKRN